MARKKGDKDYTKSEKQLLISLINDYSLFGATDNEIIQMLSTKDRQENIRNSFLSIKERSYKEREENLKHGLITMLDINLLNIIGRGWKS